MDVIINNPASTAVAPVAAPVTMTGQVYAPAPYAYPAYREEHHFGFGGFFLFPLLFILGAAIFLRRMRRRFMRGGGARGNWGHSKWGRDNWERGNWNSQNGSDSRANSNEPQAQEAKAPENFDKDRPSSSSSSSSRPDMGRPDMGKPDMGERREWWEAFVGERGGKDRALEIARERFAKGEIRFEEFETIRRGLMGQG